MTKSRNLIKFSLKIPKSIRDAMVMLSDARGNEIVHKALRAAAREPQNQIKRELRFLRAESEQGTGATHRSIITKVSYPSKGNPTYGYYMVSVNRRHKERHYRNRPTATAAFKARNKKIKVDTNKYIGFTRQHRNKAFKKQIVKSYQKSSLRVYKKLGHNEQRVRPNAYWHLLEDGFTHKSGTRFSGYKFVKSTSDRTNKISLKAFEVSLSRGLTRELFRPVSYDKGRYTGL